MKRSYTMNNLSINALIKLDERAYHHYIRVLRLKEGAPLALFNERYGEYKGVITLINKKEAFVTLKEQARGPSALPYKGLMFSLLKNETMSWMIEKATELGVTDFYPLISARSTQKSLKLEKLMRSCLDAVEQCERLDCPTFHPILGLKEALESWDPSKPLFTAIERCNLEKKADMKSEGGTFLVGPEGGWHEDEKKLLLSQSFVKPVSLGSLILRAETAALALLSQQL